MKKVYKHKLLAFDTYLGRVDEDGKVYRSTEPRKPEHYIGRVELNSGKVFDTAAGPEKYIGRVELASGKVFVARINNEEEYAGRVTDKGRFYHHKRLARDNYMGKIKDMMSFAFGGAAFLLLAFPAFEADQAAKVAAKKAGVAKKAEASKK
jgi:hypothetical protein